MTFKTIYGLMFERTVSLHILNRLWVLEFVDIDLCAQM